MASIQPSRVQPPRKCKQTPTTSTILVSGYKPRVRMKSSEDIIKVETRPIPQQPTIARNYMAVVLEMQSPIPFNNLWFILSAIQQQQQQQQQPWGSDDIYKLYCKAYCSSGGRFEMSLTTTDRRIMEETIRFMESMNDVPL